MNLGKIKQMLDWVLKWVTIRVGRLPLKPLDISAIAAQNIRSTKDFWTKFSADPALLDKLGLPDEAAKQRVVLAMAEVADYESKRLTRSKVRNHIADALVLVAVSAALYAIFR
jgi:hypothetical protein